MSYTYVIALYNVGVEYEFLGKLREALEYYTKALQACRKYLPMKKSIISTI